jgi:hypothetical protein
MMPQNAAVNPEHTVSPLGQVRSYRPLHPICRQYQVIPLTSVSPPNGPGNGVIVHGQASLSRFGKASL